MGTSGRYFFDYLTNLDCKVYEQFEDPAPARTLLARIQSDILNLRDSEISMVAKAGAVDETCVGPDQMADSDVSIQIHACHGPMREIEILHDHLLAMFEADSELMPKDILVMTPDIEAYAPYIHAVFDDRTHEDLVIPFSIADQSIRRASRFIDAFLSVLDLKGSRFGAAQIIRLLEFPGIKEKFQLKEADMPLIERWVRETRIRWGVDSTTRVKFGLPDLSENTWRTGLDRLLLGYAMPGQSRTLFAGILPYDHIEGGETKTLGRFLEFTDRLFRLVEDLEGPKRLGQWQLACNAILDQLFLPDDHTQRDLQTLRSILGEMAGREFQAGFDQDVELEVVQAYLRQHLEKKSYGSGFMTGGVTFCAMLPMRSIPFKVICLIGMNHDSFPRDHQPLIFDLIAQHPRPGDRSRRYDDKYLFLESILSARKRLYISYVGQSIEDNTCLPPSVLVSELLDTIEKNFAPRGPKILEKVVSRHRLQAFSPSYFREGTGLFSYSEENMRASSRMGTRAKPTFLIAEPIPLTSVETEQWRHLDIETLCGFYSNPVKFLLQRRFNIHLADEVPVWEERETFEVSPLRRYEIEQNLVQNRLSDAPVEDFYPIERAAGQLPHGAVGEFVFQEMNCEVNYFIQKFRRLSREPWRDQLDVDVELAGVRLTGRLSQISDSGLIQMRYAKKRVKDLIRIWIYHLVYCETAPAHLPRCSFLMCKDATLQLDDVADGRKILSYLLKLFRQGLSEPIHFFPESSFEYARHAFKGPDFEISALRHARRKWLGRDDPEYPSGESKEPYFDLCFHGEDLVDETFGQIALSVFAPLLAHCREIML
jgi:exodeoxyribonuclease V gamma subunit